MKVQSPYAKGWLILSDKAGESSLSFIRTEPEQKYTAFPDLYRQLHNGSLGRGPICLSQHFNTSNQQVMVMQKGDGGGVELDGTDLHKVIRTQQEFIGENYPTGYDPTEAIYSTGYECILNRDGRLFNRINESGYFQTSAYSDLPFQYEGKQPEVTRVIAPKGLAYFLLVFDNTEKQFIGIRTVNDLGLVLPIKNKKDESNFTLKKDDELIYSGAYGEGYANSLLFNILKRKTGYHIQTLLLAVDNIDNINALLVSDLSESIFPAGNLINEQSEFHLLRTGTRFFFSANGILYYYSLATKEYKEYCDFKTLTGKTVEIAGIDSNPEQTEVAVALSDGSFYIMDISNNALANGVPVILYQETGFGAIVDIMFKYTSSTHYRDDSERFS